MVKTASTMLPLGTEAPDFSLPDTISGTTLSRNDIAEGKPLLMMFICAHCPFVIHVEEQLAKLGNDYKERFGIAAVSANSVQTHPADAPDKLKEQAEKCGFSFPYLYDATQEVAQAYTAACTPDFFLFDDQHKLIYRGQLDASRPGSDVPVDGSDLRAAVDACLSGTAIPDPQLPSIGCNIKWHPGNEPSYFG